VKTAVAIVGAAIALTASTAAARRAVVTCSAENAGLKTLSDPQRDLVRLRPRLTTVATINGLRPPRPTPTTRETGFQRRVWRVRAQIVEYKLEQDGDIALVLYDGKRSYLTAAMPGPHCLSAKTRARRAIEGARAFLEGLCGPARPSWRPLGAVVYLDGVGYWDSPRRRSSRSGHARNDAALHPVTNVRLVAGCA
jgi:hypothetical protein